jgi:hypothetical protein
VPVFGRKNMSILMVMGSFTMVWWLEVDVLQPPLTTSLPSI